MIRDHDVKMSSGLGICKHLPRIKYSSSLVLREPRALMNEAGLGNEGSVDAKAWASLGMVALLFKVNHSHKKQASQINATCSCAAKCVGSSHMMYPHCFMHCAQDISSSCPPCRLHPRPTLWIAIGYCFCLATMHTHVPYSMDSMGQHRGNIFFPEWGL